MSCKTSSSSLSMCIPLLFGCCLHAGVNGLEAGQTFIVACATLGHNLMSVAGYAAASPAVRDGHLFSAYLMMPLAATTLGLLVHNW